MNKVNTFPKLKKKYGFEEITSNTGYLKLIKQFILFIQVIDSICGLIKKGYYPMAKHIPTTIKIRGETCFHISSKVMKALYDANLHKSGCIIYNEEFYVKPSELLPNAVFLLKQHGVKLIEKEIL